MSEGIFNPRCFKILYIFSKLIEMTPPLTIFFKVAGKMSMSECSVIIGKTVKQVVKFTKCSKTESLVLPGKNECSNSARVNEIDDVEVNAASNIVDDSREGDGDASNQKDFTTAEKIAINIDNGLAQVTSNVSIDNSGKYIKEKAEEMSKGTHNDAKTDIREVLPDGAIPEEIQGDSTERTAGIEEKCKRRRLCRKNKKKSPHYVNETEEDAMKENIEADRLAATDKEKIEIIASFKNGMAKAVSSNDSEKYDEDVVVKVSKLEADLDQMDDQAVHVEIVSESVTSNVSIGDSGKYIKENAEERSKGSVSGTYNDANTDIREVLPDGAILEEIQGDSTGKLVLSTKRTGGIEEKDKRRRLSRNNKKISSICIRD